MADELPSPTLDSLFPKGSRLLLTGGGKEFIERIGIEAAREAVLSVLRGENIRTQTEPLSRRRIAQITGGLIYLFARGHSENPKFTEQLSALAVEQIATARRTGNAGLWISQWLLGLTGKSVQNVLRNNPEARDSYIADFEAAVADAAEKCRADMGDLTMSLGFVRDGAGHRVELDWNDITRLTTAIGSATLTLRGSDKAIYGKLFERLVLGSVLEILGFERVNRDSNSKLERVFWLSDSRDNRESDATLLLSPGKLARFDIGFIGPGNPEISKGKLSSFAREIELAGTEYGSFTFIIIDRLPRTGKTETAAERINAEIIQMSMQFWPQLLARRLGDRLGFVHELQQMPEDQIAGYLERQLAGVKIEDFLAGVTPEDLATDLDGASTAV